MCVCVCVWNRGDLRIQGYHVNRNTSAFEKDDREKQEIFVISSFHLLPWLVCVQLWKMCPHLYLTNATCIILLICKLLLIH